MQAYLDHIWKGKLENLTASNPSNSYLLWINRTLLMYAHRTRCVVWSHVVCCGHTLASWIALSHFRDIMCIMCSGFTGPLADTGQPCRPADRDTADTFALSSSRFEWRCNYGTLCCTARIAATRRCWRSCRQSFGTSSTRCFTSYFWVCLCRSTRFLLGVLISTLV